MTKNIEDAKKISKNFLNPAINDAALTNILETSKASDGTYRPYLAALVFIATNYQMLIKADDVSWAYDKNKLQILQTLLTLQQSLDKNLPKGVTIPQGMDGQLIVDAFVAAQATDTGKSVSGLAFMVYG